MRQQLIRQMTEYLQSLDSETQIDAINQFRLALHQLSPFRDQPIDCVLWVKSDVVTPNAYNPNNVAPPEKKLLQKSLEQDGFTQPIVVVKQTEQCYEIVDGFHRHELAKTKSSLHRQLHGYLPVSCLRPSPEGPSARMASTIRHNRARGRHQINAMSNIVRELSQLGWSGVRIGQELGMDPDEVMRLRQLNGLLELFADRQYSDAWTVK